jgi:hypothetical protein
MTGIHNIVLAMDPALASPDKKNPNPLSAGNVNIRPAAGGRAAADTMIPA